MSRFWRLAVCNLRSQARLCRFFCLSSSVNHSVFGLNFTERIVIGAKVFSRVCREEEIISHSASDDKQTLSMGGSIIERDELNLEKSMLESLRNEILVDEGTEMKEEIEQVNFTK